MTYALFIKTFYPTHIEWRPGEAQYWILKKDYASQFCEKVDNCESEPCELPLKQVSGQAAPEFGSELTSKYLKKTILQSPKGRIPIPIAE